MGQLNFRQTVSSTSDAYEIKSSSWTGTIKNIIVHFPPGSNALVEVKVFHGSTQILPEKGGVALDDATPSFGVERWIRLGDPIRVDWINHDDTYEHTISVVVNIEEKFVVK